MNRDYRPSAEKVGDLFIDILIVMALKVGNCNHFLSIFSYLRIGAWNQSQPMMS